MDGAITPAARTPRFRDPPPLEERARALRTEIAKILVRAPTLPIELPLFGLRLLDVATAGRAIALVVGETAPVAHVRINARERASSGVVPAVELTRPRVVTCEIERRHESASRFARELTAMAERIEAAVTASQWDAAKRLARELRTLPIGLPLENFRQLVPGVTATGLVRLGFLCNQDCGLCWQGRDWGAFDAAQIRVWIEDLRMAGAQSLSVSGGEPTLDPALEDHIRFARALGFDRITLETNAVQLAKEGVARRLHDAGLTHATVSLHSGDAAVSDRITRAPGTFVRTVRGIHALLEAGVETNLNCVLTNEGLDHIAGLPDFVRSSFGDHPRLDSLMVSLPTNAFDSNLDAEISPDPVRLRRVLPAVIDRAFALGLVVRGLDGPCGPPLCAFGADRRITALRPVSESLTFREYLPGCATCAVKHACFGVREGQAKRYGDACIAPFESAPRA
jgi:hypothetical protein